MGPPALLAPQRFSQDLCHHGDVPKVEETKLPGVGVRHDFVTNGGNRIGMITHRSGRRELLIYDRDDPDSCRETLRLEEDDVHTLNDMLGGSDITEHLSELEQSVEGLTIDWVRVVGSSACSGCTISDVGFGTDVSASVVAVLRDGRSIPAPPLDFELRAGDTAVVVGTQEGTREMVERLQGTSEATPA